MTIDKHNCTKEEFYVLAKTKPESEEEDFLICSFTKTGKVSIPGRDFPEGEVYPPENPISTDIPPDPTTLVEMEVGEVQGFRIVEPPAPEVSPVVVPEPKKSWKKVKAAK